MRLHSGGTYRRCRAARYISKSRLMLSGGACQRERVGRRCEMEVRWYERLTLAYRKTVTSRFSKGRNEVPRATPRLSVGRTYERDMGAARLCIGTKRWKRSRNDTCTPFAFTSDGVIDPRAGRALVLDWYDRGAVGWCLAVMKNTKPPDRSRRVS